MKINYCRGVLPTTNLYLSHRSPVRHSNNIFGSILCYNNAEGVSIEKNHLVAITSENVLLLEKLKSLVYFKKTSSKSFWNGINDDRIDVRTCLRLLYNIKETIAFNHAIIVATGTGSWIWILTRLVTVS